MEVITVVRSPSRVESFGFNRRRNRKGSIVYASGEIKGVIRNETDGKACRSKTRTEGLGCGRGLRAAAHRRTAIHASKLSFRHFCGIDYLRYVILLFRFLRQQKHSEMIFRPPNLGNIALPYTLGQGRCDFPYNVKNF
jgi:hypothetical protein